MTNNYLSSLLKNHQNNIVLICFLLVWTVGISQTKSIDSLRNLLSNTQNDSIRFELTQKLAFDFLFTQLDSSMVYAIQLNELANKNNSISFKGRSLEVLGRVNAYQNHYDKAKQILNEALELAEKHDLDKSIIYSSLGITYQREGLYEKSIEYFFVGLKLDEKESNNDGIITKSVNIANTYSKLGDNLKSIEYKKNVIHLIENTKNKKIRHQIGVFWNNMAVDYAQLNKLDSCIYYLKKSLHANSLADNKAEISRSYHNIGIIFREKNQLDSALHYTKKGLQINEILKDTLELVLSNRAVGTIYSKLNDYTNSLSYLDKANELGIQINNPSLISDNNLAFSKLYEQFGDHKKSLEAYKKYISYKDSIFKINSQKNIDELKVSYETEKKERAIAEQQIQIQNQELDIIKKQRQVTLWVIIGGILALLLGITFWFNKERQKRKQQQIENLQKQQEIIKLEALVSGEEKERVRLAQDLHDGINGDLSVIKFKINSLDKKTFSETETGVHNQAISMLDNAIDQVRRISHNLAPPSLHNFSLLEAIRQYCNKVQQTNSFTVDFQNFGNLFSFDSEKETAIYRIIQELLNNISKHAKASEVLVQLNSTEEVLEITVEDDGQGFDTQNVKNGIGLQNIASRVSFLKGNLHINSGNDGSAFIITIPYLTSTKIS